MSRRRNGPRRMWSLAVTEKNVQRMEAVHRHLSSQGLKLNRSAFINRAIEEALDRINLK